MSNVFLRNLAGYATLTYFIKYLLDHLKVIYNEALLD